MNRQPLRRWQYLALLFAVAVVAAGCQTTPITGRRQLLLLPEQQEISMGLAAFEDTKSKEPASANAEYCALVNRVGTRIAEAAGKPDYQWEFHLIASQDPNACCLPGGKVTVNEGILPVCANEAGLAVVMSHEIAHALARHGGERISQNMAVEGARYVVNYVTKDQKERQRELIMQAYGLGAQYGVILPYSRKHESEADHMGAILMARAGYDPGEAPRFWQRFAALKQNGNTPEFLSTHPSDERRSQDLLAMLPEAERTYQQAAAKYGLGVAIATTAPQALATARVPPAAATPSLAPLTPDPATPAPAALRAAITPLPAAGRETIR